METIAQVRKKCPSQAKQQQNTQRAATVQLRRTTANFKT